MAAEPFWSDGPVTVYSGDCLDVMAAMEECSVDAVVTDPPYGLEFMGREWDTFKPSNARIRQPSERDRQPGAAHNMSTSLVARNVPDSYVAGKSFQAWCEAWAAECLRVLKPGGHLLAFGGTRTYHRMVSGIEDAGFEVRDSLHWVYGSGFPKSLDVSKAIDKAAGAEREVIGRRTDGRYASGFSDQAKHAQGAAAHDYSAGWVGDPAVITAPATEDAARWDGWGTALKPAHEPIVVARKPLAGTVAVNVLAYGTGALNVDGCRVGASGGGTRCINRDEDGKCLGHNAGYNHGRGGTFHGPESGESSGRWPPNILLGHSADCNGECVPGCPVAEMDAQSGVLTSGANTVKRASGKGGTRSASIGAESRLEGTPMIFYGDSGGASRFFPCFRYEAKAPTRERPKLPDGTAWPTVKPLALMRWLVRLVTPPGGTVLDCFAGTGTTGQAAALEGFRCILIERDPTALELIKARLGKPVLDRQDGLF